MSNRKCVTAASMLGSLLVLFSLPGPSAPTQFAQAEDPPPATPRFLVYTVRADLQRRLTPAHTDLYVLLDTTDAFQDNLVRAEGLGLKELREELTKHKGAGKHLHFNLFFKRAAADRFRGEALLRYAMIGFGHEAGFSAVTAFGYWPNSNETWADRLSEFRSGKARQAEGDERPTGDDAVKVYPVRTEFSRCLTSGADCAVILETPLPEGSTSIPDGLRESITKYVSELKLSQKQKVHFALRRPAGTGEVPQPLINEFYRFAEALGFKTSAVSF